jgi:SHS family lactate transporter-like MFS transporter
VFTYVYPQLEASGDLAWRAMLWLGIAPAFLVLWIRARVAESPVWLERQRYLREHRARERMSLLRIFRGDIVRTTLQTSLLMAALMCSFYSITYWYATFLREGNRATLPYVVLFNVGGIVGGLACGYASESRLGRRGAATLAASTAILMVPLYLYSRDSLALGLGALTIGTTGAGMWGIVPTYLIERFPTAIRGLGAGFAYHMGAALGSVTPALVGVFRDRCWALRDAMAVCIVAALLLVIVVLWLGPETRGRQLEAIEV